VFEASHAAQGVQRAIPPASKKALTASLRSLEAARVVLRRDLSSSVLHVEYELADAMREPLVTLRCVRVNSQVTNNFSHYFATAADGHGLLHKIARLIYEKAVAPEDLDVRWLVDKVRLMR
jgi:hypothetical protein